MRPVGPPHHLASPGHAPGVDATLLGTTPWCRARLGTVGDMPEVSGIAPFSINEMMLTKGERRAVVLVKGVTKAGVENVLDLPHQMIDGDLEGLARAGAKPEEDETCARAGIEPIMP